MSHRGDLIVCKHVKRRLFVGAVALISSLIPLEKVSAAAPDIAGTTCAVEGSTRKAKKISYTCARVGRRRIWLRIDNSQSTPMTTTPRVTTSTASSTTIPVSTTTSLPKSTAAETVAKKINSYVDPMRARNQPIPAIEYRFGPSVSSEDRTMIRQLAEAFFRLGSFSSLAQYRNAISVSTSNAEAVETTAPWTNISQWGNIAGGYTGTGTYALVIQNLTAHRCGVGVTAAACAANGNGGSLGAFKTRVNVLHEFSHGGKIALMGYDPSQLNSHLDRLPMWLASGISNVQGAMILAVLDGSVYSNPNISEAQARRCRNVPISLASIRDTEGDEGWGCKGIGTGDFANEILVARFGLDKVLEFIANSRSNPVKSQWPDWSSVWASQFQQAFLQSPESFERDVEVYRSAVLNRTSLPTDFLDAKARP